MQLLKASVCVPPTMPGARDVMVTVVALLQLEGSLQFLQVQVYIYFRLKHVLHEGMWAVATAAPHIVRCVLGR